MEEKRKWIRKGSSSKSMWFAYATMWVATAIAVIVGMIITKSPWCLWALLIPTGIEFKSSNTSESDDEEDADRFEDDLK